LLLSTDVLILLPHQAWRTLTEVNLFDGCA
jgi:hypothetical protein